MCYYVTPRGGGGGANFPGKSVTKFTIYILLTLRGVDGGQIP